MTKIRKLFVNYRVFYKTKVDDTIIYQLAEQGSDKPTITIRLFNGTINANINMRSIKKFLELRNVLDTLPNDIVPNRKENEND